LDEEKGYKKFCLGNNAYDCYTSIRSRDEVTMGMKSSAETREKRVRVTWVDQLKKRFQGASSHAAVLRQAESMPQR